jgi:NADH-quinone oxidoreductase subunit L
MLVGAISAVLAALMALAANDLKRVLAYSTVSQLGYMFYAVGAGGVFASQFHLMSHAVFKALLFLAAGAVIHVAGTRDMRQMGGFGKQMPLVRTVFVLGALSLAGIPIMNGFWSKELVLEAGLHSGALWLYALMVFTAGLTALYTCRCVWMVFYGEPHQERHLHDAPSYMRWALIPLAAGTLLTTLMAGPFSRMLERTLPDHGIHAETTFHWLMEVVSAPATLIALAAVADGIAAWGWRGRFGGLARGLRWVMHLADNSFGFETINHQVVAQVNRSAETLRLTQTGYLNWNVAGITFGLVVVLVLLAVGG